VTGPVRARCITRLEDAPQPAVAPGHSTRCSAHTATIRHGRATPVAASRGLLHTLRFDAARTRTREDRVVAR
jgi:hypothetical protein